MSKMPATYWVSMHHYGTAIEKWPTRDIRINTYLPRSPFYIIITKPGYTVQKRGRYRRLKVRSTKNETSK